VRRRRIIPGLVGLVLGIGLLLNLADHLWPLALPEADKSFSTLVLDREGVPLRAFSDQSGVWRHQVTTAGVSHLYLEALLAYEDRYFYSHPGVNPFSIMRAAVQNFLEGRVVSGGSTLTMQVARILHPHSRSLGGKLQQVLRALQLEWHLSKTEILELYLNYAPFGGVLEGVQAASQQYLHKPANNLRPSEAAMLAVLPQAPSRLRPDRHPERAQAARDKVLDRLAGMGVWSQEAAAQAKREPVAVWPLLNPMDAPLLSRRLKGALPGERVIRSTIALQIQQPLANLVEQYADRQGQRISAAVMVIDNANHEVLAYVGSSRFADEKRAGYMDMATAVRSPGSTLKPFLFGLSLDAGLIHSHSLLADVPRVLASYRPGNFTRGFIGPVSAREALQRSLNVPFVQLMEAYGAQTFANRLLHVGQPLSIPQGKPNPAIILGGAGTTLERLAALYSGLANEGQVYDLVYLRGENLAQGRRLLSPEAAWITLKTLQELQAPEGFGYGLSNALRPTIAWKTGTSSGHRDVWAVGVTPSHTVAIWLGRPDGLPMRDATGLTVAGPLLFSVFSMLPDDRSRFTKPPGVRQVEVCWPDGRRAALVARGCDVTHLAYTVKGVAPPTLRPEYRAGFFQSTVKILLDAESGLRVSRHCAKGETHLVEATIWPEALDQWLPTSFRRQARLPAFGADCSAQPVYEEALRVIGLEEGQVFRATTGNIISLFLRTDGKNDDVVWYLDGKPVAISTPSTVITLTSDMRGEHEVIALDAEGGIRRISFSLL
jgi:penicillin-binding protein 1C